MSNPSTTLPFESPFSFLDLLPFWLHLCTGNELLTLFPSYDSLVIWAHPTFSFLGQIQGAFS